MFSGGPGNLYAGAILRWAPGRKDESYPRVELWQACHAFLDSAHADQNQSGVALVENGTNLLEAVPIQPVRFIEQDQRGRMRDGRSLSNFEDGRPSTGNL